jgi:23S rRNA (uridine2552-2'-O)-methyltransferase
LLDLGAAPGSWAQYASQRLGSRGRLLGIDLKPVKQELPNAQFVQADLREAALGSWLAEAGLRDPVDGVLSDMAPSTSGHQRTDHLQSAGLCEMALAVAHQHLRPGGFLIAKMLEGGEAPAFFHQIKAEFGRAKQMRLQSTRKGSKEVFFVGADFRGPAT